MANNRIYLRCKHCGKGFFLGKSFGGHYYTDNNYYKNDIITDLNNFYKKHCFCGEKENTDDINYLEPRFMKEEKHYENNFEVAYEIYHKEN